jgi:rhodanese-related sulfurtransferase
MAVSAFVFPERKTSLNQLIEDESFIKSYKIETVTTDEFALCLLKIMECNKFQIFDFRTEDEFRKMSLPKSTLFTIDNLFEKEPNKLLNLKHKVNVFVANDELTEKKMAIIATELGYKRIQIVKGGLNAFKEEILNFQPISNPKNIDEENINRFRSKAKAIIPILIQQNKSAGPVKKTQKRVVGGC